MASVITKVNPKLLVEGTEYLGIRRSWFTPSSYSLIKF